MVAEEGGRRTETVLSLSKALSLGPEKLEQHNDKTVQAFYCIAVLSKNPLLLYFVCWVIDKRNYWKWQNCWKYLQNITKFQILSMIDSISLFWFILLSLKMPLIVIVIIIGVVFKYKKMNKNIYKYNKIWESVIEQFWYLK